MENKNVGFLILGISVLVVVIIFLFNNALKDIVGASCGLEHSESCPMFTSINQQTYLSLSIAGVLFIIGLALLFSKPEKQVVIQKVKEKEKKKKIDISDLNSEEKKVFNIIREKNAAFQADLIEQTGFGKVKITRILNRLESKGLVERKRRGMTNVVVMK